MHGRWMPEVKMQMVRLCTLLHVGGQPVSTSRQKTTKAESYGYEEYLHVDALQLLNVYQVAVALVRLDSRWFARDAPPTVIYKVLHRQDKPFTKVKQFLRRRACC